MKIEEVIACSFPEWYPTFKEITFPSRVLALPEDFIKYLLADNVILPSSTLTTTKRLEECSDSESEGDIDWNQAELETPNSEAPSFPDLEERITSIIKQLGGQAFIKLNWSSPKDAAWMSLNNALKCYTPDDVYLLLKSSNFIVHDLTQPFTYCEDDHSNIPPFPYYLVFREWIDISPSLEFRCFVRKRQLIAICQRDDSQFYEYIGAEESDIVDDICNFHDDYIDKFPLDNYVYDVVRKGKGDVILVDFNPYGRPTDALLYDWDQEPLLLSIEIQSVNSMTDESIFGVEPVFRYITENSGLRPNPYRQYSVPEDCLHLSSGTDPWKLLDLLKLQTNDVTDSD